MLGVLLRTAIVKLPLQVDPLLKSHNILYFVTHVSTNCPDCDQLVLQALLCCRWELGEEARCTDANEALIQLLAAGVDQHVVDVAETVLSDCRRKLYEQKVRRGEGVRDLQHTECKIGLQIWLGNNINLAGHPHSFVSNYPNFEWPI